MSILFKLKKKTKGNVDTLGSLTMSPYVIIVLCCMLENFHKTLTRVTQHMFPILGTSLTLQNWLGQACCLPYYTWVQSI